MQNISTYKRYLNKQIEFVNSETLINPEVYELTFPHSYDSSWTYKTVFLEAVKSPLFSGRVKAELLNVITDSEDVIYEKPVIIQQVGSSEIFTQLDENSSGTYMLLDTALDKLVIRVTQVMPGTGKVVFVIRGL